MHITEMEPTGTSNASPSTGDNKPKTSSVSVTAPGQLRVIKRNGTVVPYTDDKIAVAVTKAFLAVEGGSAAASSRVHETVANMTAQITATFKRRMPSGGTIHIEEIQDQVELTLMRSGEHKVARGYVLYRAERARLREAKRQAQAVNVEFPSINVTDINGQIQPLDIERIKTIVSEACAGLKDVDAEAILKEAMRNLYDGVSIHDVNTSLVISARTLVEKEPNYTYA